MPLLIPFTLIHNPYNHLKFKNYQFHFADEEIESQIWVVSLWLQDGNYQNPDLLMLFILNVTSLSFFTLTLGSLEFIFQLHFFCVWY